LRALRRGPASGSTGGLAGLVRLAQLTLEIGEPGLDVRIGAGWGRGWAGAIRRGTGSGGARPPDLRVCLLDCFEATCRLGRATVVVGVVKLHQPPVRSPNLIL